MKKNYFQFFVRCINDTNRPWDANLTWIKRGRVYEVEEVRKNAAMDGSFALILKGMNPGGKFDGYRSDRFENWFPPINSLDVICLN